MKRRAYISLFLLILFIITGFQVAEDPVFIQKLKAQLREYNSNYPEEKVYLQFDKPFYKPGETIWFNAMVLSSNTHTPTVISDVLYAELIDPKGNVASRLELVIKEGASHGDFSIQENAAGGLYSVRAFTRWMKNFGEASYFKKEIQVQRIITPRLLLKLDYEKESYGAGDLVVANITVTNLKNEKVNGASISNTVRVNGQVLLTNQISSDRDGTGKITFRLPHDLNTTDGLLQAIVSVQGVEESISRSIPIVLNQITMQFFPEGGFAVENVTTRVAFKARNEFGKGADVSGVVMDESNMVITRFESFHMGMGAFEFKPLPGKKYYARIDNPSGNASLSAIPQALSSGYTLNLKSADTTFLEWTIYSPTDNEVYLTGQTHGDLVYAQSVQVSSGINTVKVPTRKFPAGIAVFTLFDGQGNEQCERLVFANRDKGLHIKLTTDKKQYLPRDKVQLRIKTTDNSGKPIPAKLSLAVADDQILSFADDKQDNILSALLLSSEVRGEIQEPSFYFDPAESKATAALDYLLMTQGWRRFNWKEINNPKRAITFNPEKVRSIAGQTVDSKHVGYATEVTLIEAGNKRRVEKVTTTYDGRFVFMNIDPTVPILLLVRKPAEVSLQKEIPFFISLNDEDKTKIYRQVPGEAVIVAPANTLEAEAFTENGLDMNLDTDVSSLSEVVVVGYGTEKASSLTGSIVRINESTGMESRFPVVAVENLIQGRAAGITVQSQSGSAGANANVRIRGVASLGNGNSDPLFIIDGQVIGTSLNANFSNGSMLGPEDIQSIEIMQSPEAAALFGSAAANGVISITTKSRIGYSYFQTRRRNSRYSSAIVNPRNFSVTKEFYVDPPLKNKSEKREDFRSTIYWNHTVVTDEKGHAELSFYNNDAVSAFRITAEGFSGAGLIGRSEEVYHTQLPFSLDAKLPEYLGFEDILKLPVVIRNETSSILSGNLTLTLPTSLRVEEQPVTRIEVEPMSSKTYWYTILPTGTEGKFPIHIKLESPGYHDEIENTIRIQSVGFPVRISFSGRQKEKNIRFTIHDAEHGTVQAEFTAFPDILSDLFTGAEAILHEPYGCFEQVSSSTFPNILALQFLRQSGMTNQAVEKKALAYIKDGYKRLMAYEIKGGGFEWFGHPPAHEGLTAYGLIEFMEMKKVYDGVDENMIRRTRDWMLSRKDGKGGFRLHKGLHGFSQASEEVDNAYITYALSETGTTDILQEYNHAYAEVIRSKDMYRMALVANTAYNLGKLDDYAGLIKLFQREVEKSGFQKFPMDHSVMRSYGNSLLVETVSLWAIALMKPVSTDLDPVKKSIDCILQNRSYGQFGSTQATALALKALTEYARLVRTTRENGEIQLRVNNTLSERIFYKGNERDKLVMNKFAASLGNGEQNLSVLFNQTENALPYSVNIQWRTKEPPSSNDCKVKLTTTLAATTIRTNETVRLTVNLKNKTSNGLPMTIAIVSIPAGLSVQPWQLKELQEKKVFDFYEIMNNNLVLYYREMGPGETQTVNLDLKAEIPGTYTAAPSTAYLYYTNEYKDWTRGNSITIN